MELLFTSRWYILIIIILVIPSLCIKKRESVKEYRVDEILEDGHFSNLPNGDPIYIVNVKKHEFKKIKAINDFFVQGNTITDKGKNFEYKIQMNKGHLKMGHNLQHNLKKLCHEKALLSLPNLLHN